MLKFKSKLPNVGTTIFTEMSALAKEHNAINLSQGFPNFEPDQKLKDLISYYLNQDKNQYPPMFGVKELRESISQKISKIHQYQPDPETEINITAGATQAIFTSILTFVKKDDEVIVIEPSFDCYGPAIELCGAKHIAYEMKSPEFHVDWDEVNQLINDRTTMIIINSPHNPTGSILRDTDFRKLEAITKGKNLVILSDEVYQHLIYDGEEHCSIIRYPELYKKAIAVFSFGKTFHCTGWKVGYVVMPPDLMLEFRKVHQFNVFTVNSFIQYALADYLKEESHYLGLPEFYVQKRDLLSDYISKSRFNLIPSSGSYFVLADYSNISSEEDRAFTRKLTIEKNLASIPISVFYSSGKQEKIIRLCFAKTDEVLHQAGEIIMSI